MKITHKLKQTRTLIQTHTHSHTLMNVSVRPKSLKWSLLYLDFGGRTNGDELNIYINLPCAANHKQIK